MKLEIFNPARVLYPVRLTIVRIDTASSPLTCWAQVNEGKLATSNLIPVLEERFPDTEFVAVPYLLVILSF